jgi:NAD(P)-dependent dehydrogenase (short-subunit alcohol dehydrogenase family)
LRDRVILATGATGALGTAAATASSPGRSHRRAAGTNGAQAGNLYDAILAAGGPKPAIYPLDLAGATETDYAELAEALARELRGLHGLMHCAAELGHLGPLADIGGMRWQRLLHINLTAPFLLTRALTPLHDAGQRRQKSFSSAIRPWATEKLLGPYGVAKSGLAAYSRILDEESAGFRAARAGIHPRSHAQPYPSARVSRENRWLRRQTLGFTPKRSFTCSVVPTYLPFLPDNQESDYVHAGLRT